MTKFKLKVSENGTDWTAVPGEFNANTDKSSIVSNKLPKPVKCTAIRICPTGWNSHISMRAEVYYRNI